MSSKDTYCTCFKVILLCNLVYAAKRANGLLLFHYPFALVFCNIKLHILCSWQHDKYVFFL